MSLFRAAPCRRLLSVRHFLGNSNARPRIAVVLSGSGVFDGTEIHEASSILCHLSRAGAGVRIFAPDKDFTAVDHVTGQEHMMKRNAMVEAARIARGEVQSLSQLEHFNFEAVIFPGGFGAAKNLSNFALSFEDCSVDKDVARVLKEFHSRRRPIGLCCIAPVLAAKVLSDQGITVTLGGERDDKGRWPYSGMVEKLKKLATHEKKDVTELCVDEVNKIITTPAFMCNAPLHIIHDALEDFVEKVVELASPKV